MGNADAGKRLRANQTKQTVVFTQEALASKGTHIKEFVEMTKLIILRLL